MSCGRGWGGVEWVREVSASVGWVTCEGVLRRRVEWAMGGECSWLGYWVRPGGGCILMNGARTTSVLRFTRRLGLSGGECLYYNCGCSFTVSGLYLDELYLYYIWTVS